uniref:DUF2812 domain-containing protein n=1 Tax=Acetatifactor sp. TaxID=1872090 RepID=UPI0040568C0D
MIKFRLYYDKDKETKWLNEMAKQGYAMTKYFAGFYTFEECTPGEYIYQVDFSDNFFNVSKDYFEFMEETGVEIVQTWGVGWIFLRKKAADGDFVLYTDVDSAIEHYTKIRTMFKVGIVIELICFIYEIYAAIFSSSVFLIFAFLLVVLIVAMLQTVIRTNHIIAELKERKGEVSQYNNRFQHSPILVCGLLFNACALAMQNPELEPYKLAIQIVAILLMAIGLYQIASGKQEK